MPTLIVLDVSDDVDLIAVPSTGLTAGPMAWESVSLRAKRPSASSPCVKRLDILRFAALQATNLLHKQIPHDSISIAEIQSPSPSPPHSFRVLMDFPSAAVSVSASAGSPAAPLPSPSSPSLESFDVDSHFSNLGNAIMECGIPIQKDASISPPPPPSLSIADSLRLVIQHAQFRLGGSSVDAPPLRVLFFTSPSAGYAAYEPQFVFPCSIPWPSKVDIKCFVIGNSAEVRHHFPSSRNGSGRSLPLRSAASSISQYQFYPKQEAVATIAAESLFSSLFDEASALVSHSRFSTAFLPICVVPAHVADQVASELRAAADESTEEELKQLADSQGREAAEAVAASLAAAAATARAAVVEEAASSSAYEMELSMGLRGSSPPQSASASSLSSSSAVSLLASKHLTASLERIREAKKRKLGYHDGKNSLKNQAESMIMGVKTEEAAPPPPLLSSLRLSEGLAKRIESHLSPIYQSWKGCLAFGHVIAPASLRPDPCMTLVPPFVSEEESEGLYPLSSVLSILGFIPSSVISGCATVMRHTIHSSSAASSLNSPPSLLDSLLDCMASEELAAIIDLQSTTTAPTSPAVLPIAQHRLALLSVATSPASSAPSASSSPTSCLVLSILPKDAPVPWLKKSQGELDGSLHNLTVFGQIRSKNFPISATLYDPVLGPSTASIFPSSSAHAHSIMSDASAFKSYTLNPSNRPQLFLARAETMWHDLQRLVKSIKSFTSPIPFDKREAFLSDCDRLIATALAHGWPQLGELAVGTLEAEKAEAEADESFGVAGIIATAINHIRKPNAKELTKILYPAPPPPNAAQSSSSSSATAAASRDVSSDSESSMPLPAISRKRAAAHVAVSQLGIKSEQER